MALLCNPSFDRDYSLHTLFSDHREPLSHEGDLEPNALLPHEIVPKEEALPNFTASPGTVTDGTDRDKLFGRFDPWLKRLMRRYRMTPESREDAYGELYCHFCGLLDRYDPRRGVPLEPYLYRQLGAFLYTHVRSGWRRSRREVPVYADDGVENVGCPAGDPTREWDDRLLKSHVGSLLPQAFREIPDRQQHVITMRYYQELSYEEIAERLAIRPATARSLARHGLQSLREWMRKRRIAWD